MCPPRKMETLVPGVGFLWRLEPWGFMEDISAPAACFVSTPACVPTIRDRRRGKAGLVGVPLGRTESWDRSG